jgi:hypothetical protein
VSARDDHALAYSAKTIVGPNIGAALDAVFDELDYLRQWIDRLAERRPTDTREAEPD